MPATATLSELLLDGSRRPAVVEDMESVVDAEISANGGLLVKSGYAMVKKSKPGFVARTIDDVLPNMVEVLDPYYQEAVTSGARVSDVFAAKSPEITQQVITAVDSYAANSNRDAVRKGYGRFKDQLPKQIPGMLPKLATLIEKYQAA